MDARVAAGAGRDAAEEGQEGQAPVERVLILGAAGRDYHTFNTLFRDGPRGRCARVVGFTHAQIPHITNDTYPSCLAGPDYPRGLPIWPEEQLEAVIAAHRVDRAILAYSDLSYAEVMALAARARAAGAAFELLPWSAGALACAKPVVAVTATRTGCGKSQVAGMVANAARAAGLRVVLVRHPMPYGQLEDSALQRFAAAADLDAHHTTLEEREEYEQHMNNGVIVYAGVDYGAILAAAAAEADVIIWDGGNNDTPFARPDLWLCVADPLRPAAQETHYPGDVNFRRADIIVVNKANSAPKEGVAAVVEAAQRLNPRAKVICTSSVVTAADPAAIRGRRVVVLEDGPTLTHGGMPTGAGYVAALKYGAAAVVDPRPHLVGELAVAAARYPHLGPVLPALGYSAQQLADLEATLNAVPADAVVVGTPTDVSAVLRGVRLPLVPVHYGLDPSEPGGGAELAAALAAFFRGLAAPAAPGAGAAR